MSVVLTDGQWQLNGVRFGRNTRMPIQSIDLAGYGVGASDYQVARADELRFSYDTLQPGTITFTIGALDNKIIPWMAGSGDPSGVPDLTSAAELLEQLATAWKSDVTRKTFGGVDVMYYTREGQTFQIYGRPRKFAHNAKSMKSQYRTATGEFQRVDTLCYSDQNYTVTVLPGSTGVLTQNIVRSGGMAPTWLQMFLFGPITAPRIQVGTLPVVTLNYDVPAGKIVEINSYPWQRRVVNSDGINLRPNLTQPYLDQIQVGPNRSTGVGLWGTGVDANTKLIVNWQEAYNTI